jgi:hypothetical protein
MKMNAKMKSLHSPRNRGQDQSGQIEVDSDDVGLFFAENEEQEDRVKELGE